MQTAHLGVSLAETPQLPLDLHLEQQQQQLVLPQQQQQQHHCQQEYTARAVAPVTELA